MDDSIPLTDPYAEAFRLIRFARRRGLPVPRIADLLPQRPLALLSLVGGTDLCRPAPEVPSQAPHLRLVASR